MNKCAYCGTRMLFGGTEHEGRRFCNNDCLQKGFTAAVASQIPAEIIEQQVWQVHQGNCPQCAGRGPVDVHTSYRVWSALVVTSWSSRPHVCCRSCGTKARLQDAVFSLVLGWWGLPWGFIWTPVQVVRNVAGIFSSTDSSKPSPELENILRLHVAMQALNRQASPGA